MNEGKPSFKSRSWNKKSKAKTQCVHNVNGKRFYYKNMIRIEQDHEKKNVFKISVEHIQSNVRFYFYLYLFDT
jgi:hypothetical protein